MDATPDPTVPEPEPEPEPTVPVDPSPPAASDAAPDAMLTPEQIAALLAGTEPETVAEPVAESDPEPEPDALLTPEQIATLLADSEQGAPELEAVAEAEPDPEPLSEPEPDPEPAAATETEPDPEPLPEPETESAPAPDPEPEPVAEPEPTSDPAPAAADADEAAADGAQPTSLRDILARAAAEDDALRPHDVEAAADVAPVDAVEPASDAAADTDVEAPAPDEAPADDLVAAVANDAADAAVPAADAVDLPELGVDPWADGREPRRRRRLVRLAPVLVLAGGLAAGLVAFLGVSALAGGKHPGDDPAASLVAEASPSPGTGGPEQPSGEGESPEPGASAGPGGSPDPGASGGGQHVLRIGMGGTGAGTVISQPSGISCGSGLQTCEASFPYGTVVIIEALPQDGSIVDSWVGCDSASGSTCVHTMTHDQTAAVTFLRLATPTPGPTPTPTPKPGATPKPDATRGPGQTLDPGADTDGDSYPNEMELRYGSDPLDESSTPENALFVNLDNVSTCEDGLDNDGDGDFDAADSGCR